MAHYFVDFVLPIQYRYIGMELKVFLVFECFSVQVVQLLYFMFSVEYATNEC